MPTRASDAAGDLPPARRACLFVVACFAFVCVYFVGIFPGAADSNQRSHYQLLRALGERGTAEIGPEIEQLGSHTDIAVHGGRRLSNKAPGLSVAALPGYRLLRLVLPAPSSLEDWLVFYAARVLSVTLVVVVALLVFVRRALRTLPASPLLPLWIFALLFATPFQVYARSFFSHAFVAALLFLAFALAAHGRGPLSAAGAGFLAAAAVAAEYPAVLVAFAVGLTLLAQGPIARTASFLLGAVPPAAALAWYHARYFGGVLNTPPAASEGYADVAGRGLVGISWPAPAALAGLFLDPAHGLLYFSPFLLLWPIAAVASWRALRSDRSLLAPVLGPALLLLAIAGYVSPHWRGGWSLGPRYIVGGLMLVFWLLAARIPTLERGRTALVASILFSAALLALCGSTYWMIPYEAWNPARTVSLFFLRSGVVEFNLGVAAGLPPLTSLLPPLAACAAAFVAAARAAAIPAATLRASAAIGLAAFLLLLAIPPSPEAIANSHREGLAGVLKPTMRSGWR